jgi:chromosome segregation protein
VFLRSITIRGFKSFADKTALEFAPGVSVIVGPNGSGKSNLVDAISWALGEQGARALRGGQMADVIFAGTPTRPALGMAEVKLVIDNTAGKIPVPMTEIEVSRTIFRSGDSEYRINGQIVRLLDVTELLSETGIGRALHTVVGQGQLEEVLLARPEERRKYIEEAAGIAKHRLRKERAERKLAGLEQDLLRLQDVLAELKRQLKPLRKQAESAKRHEELTAEATLISQKLAASRLRALLDEKARRQGGWDEGQELRRLARERLEALDTEVLGAADSRAQTALALADAEQIFRATQAERSEAEKDLREALAAGSDARDRLNERSARETRAIALHDEIARAEAELAGVLDELAAQESLLGEAEAAFHADEEERRRVEDVRRRIGEDVAGRRAEAEALQRSVAAAEREKERLDESLSEVRSRFEEIEAEREGLEGEIERLDGQSSPLAERMSQLEADRRAIVEKIEELEEVRRRQEARKDLLEARRIDIEETAGSRFLKAHKGRAAGMLKDLVGAKEGYELALATALGPLSEAVVYENGDRALADAGEGRGAIFAISGGGPVPMGLSGERSLLSVVEAEPAARGIVSTLLRGVYLATDVEEASQKHGARPDASFVTPEGVLIGPGVIHTARQADSRAREIRAELQVLAHDLKATMNSLDPRKQRLEEIGGEIDFLREQIEASDAEITSAAERLLSLELIATGVRREEEVLLQRIGAVDEALLASGQSLVAIGPISAEALPELPPMPSPPMQLRVSVETLRRERASRDARMQRLRAELQSAADVDPEQLLRDLEQAELARSKAEEAVAEAEVTAARAAEAREAAAEAERLAADLESEINRSWREASTELDHLRESYEEDDRARGDIDRRVRDAERLIREGFGADPAELVAGLTDDDSVHALEKRSELVQRRLALLGRVNLLATGEFEALAERHDFMARELDDVRKAKRDLLEVVAKIDQEITETFASAYADVAVQFERLITELFPGGQGRLVLTDASDPLTSGIEIEASPGRKRVKRISLLSGGERSLTALAFLFAIFTARPSPFYLMDEVEPALDDVNLHRFLRLIEGFAKDSQVLIVTHQKRTMEIAGMMYGISLNKDGTTKVVCQRLDERKDIHVDARLEGSGAEAASVPPKVPADQPVG